MTKPDAKKYQTVRLTLYEAIYHLVLGSDSPIVNRMSILEDIDIVNRVECKYRLEVNLYVI